MSFEYLTGNMINFLNQTGYQKEACHHFAFVAMHLWSIRNTPRFCFKSPHQVIKHSLAFVNSSVNIQKKESESHSLFYILLLQLLIRINSLDKKPICSNNRKKKAVSYQPSLDWPSYIFKQQEKGLCTLWYIPFHSHPIMLATSQS